MPFTLGIDIRFTAPYPPFHEQNGNEYTEYGCNQKVNDGLCSFIHPNITPPIAPNNAPMAINHINLVMLFLLLALIFLSFLTAVMP